MVGNGEIETKQTDEGADQAFGPAQGQAEYGFERQRRRDRQRRVVRLTARRGAGLGAPGRDRRLGKPDCQAAALAALGLLVHLGVLWTGLWLGYRGSLRRRLPRRWSQ